MSDTEADAVVLFRPAALETLKPFLDLDEDSDESDGLYAETTDDGAVLVHTFQPFDAFATEPDAAREWLLQFGDDVLALHDDPRGVLFYPDSEEPDASTYDTVVRDVSGAGFWVDLQGVDDEGDTTDDLLALGLSEQDLAQMNQLAGALMGDPAVEGKASSFELGKLFEGMQRQLLGALAPPLDESDPPSGENPAPSGSGHRASREETARDEKDEEGADDAADDPGGVEVGDATRRK